MGLLKEEQEISITKLATEGMWEIYTSDRKYFRKLEKLGAKPYNVEYINGEEVGWFYKLKENQVLLRAEPKKRTMSEEQRKLAAERLMKFRNK